MIVRVYHFVILAFLFSLASCGGGSSNTQPTSDRAFAIAIQNDGKIIVAGDSYSSTTDWSTALARYDSNGMLDSSFGIGGRVINHFGGGARAIALQDDGKIVVAGYNFNTYDIFLIRYNSNGTLDQGFGIYGKVEPSAGGSNAVVIQNDGKILTAGATLSRYNSNGTLDTTFGTNGTVSYHSVSSIAIQSDNKIITTGSPYITRYNTDGSIDTSFGVNGEIYSGSQYTQTSGIALQADGKIVASGSSYNANNGAYDFAITRYNTDGSLDTTFVGSGRVVIQVSSLYSLAPTTVIIDSVSSKIVAAGYSQYMSIITRLNSDGSPDLSFNASGSIIATGGNYWTANSAISNIAVQDNNKIVVTGYSYTDKNSYDFSLARHNADGNIDLTFGTSGIVTTNF